MITNKYLDIKMKDNNDKSLGGMNQVHLFKGHPVDFFLDGEIMINATQMAKPYGTNKQPSNWTKNKNVQEMISAFNANEGRSSNNKNAITTSKGGSDLKSQGTWLHKDLAIHFAMWLDPSFGLWCGEKIQSLLMIGVVGTTDEELEALRSSNNRLREATTKVSEENKLLHKINAHLKPRADSYDSLTSLVGTYSLNEAAKVLKVKKTLESERVMGRNGFAQKLRDLGMLEKRGTLPYQKFIDKNYFRVVVSHKKGKNGFLGTSTKITAEGLDHINKKLGGFE